MIKKERVIVKAKLSEREKLKREERIIKEEIKDALTIIKSNLKDNKAMEKILKVLNKDLIEVQKEIKSI